MTSKRLPTIQDQLRLYLEELKQKIKELEATQAELEVAINRYDELVKRLKKPSK